jgi:hypothetical protein
MPGYANTAIPGGLRMGGGRRARGCWWPAGGWGRWSRPFGVGRSGGYFGGYALAAQPFEPELEKEALKHRSQALQSELDAVNKRLTEMDEQEKTS